MERSVLITGASVGIGLAAARRLAARGFRVFGASRRPPTEAIPGVSWLAMDVCNEESVRKGMAGVQAATPHLDALVCNAGYGIFGSVEEVSIEEAQAQFDTNFFGTLRTLRAAVPAMRERGAGRILIVGSLAGRAPIPFQAHYSATKAAVDALALSLHNELHAHGVAVTLIEPGDIHTEFNDRMQWNAAPDSPYGERLRSCEAEIRRLLPLAPPPEIVARTIERALTARRPRIRYTVGPESWLVPLGRRLLPDRWFLALVRSQFKI